MGDRMELWPSSARKFAQETVVEKMQQAEKIRRINEAIEALTAENIALRARLVELEARRAPRGRRQGGVRMGADEAKQVTRSDFQIADATIKLARLQQDIRRVRFVLLGTALGAMTVIGLAMGFGGH